MMDTQSSPQEFVDQAKRAYQSGQYVQAAQDFEQASRLYRGAGDSLMAAEMQNNQSVALLRARNPQAALEVLQGTDQVFAQAGDAVRQGMAMANRGSALQVLKRYKDAIESFKASADVLERAGEMNLRVDVMQLLALLYLRRLKLMDAILALQSGLAGVKNPTPRQRLMKKILFMRL